MILENWYFLLCIPVLIFMFIFYKRRSTLKFSSTNILLINNKKTYKHLIGKYMILLSCILLIIAMARPRVQMSYEPVKDEGIDIAMLFDVSGSMESIDFKPNRLEVAKKTIADFIDGRNGDRIALVVFGGNAYTRVPLTLDHEMIQQSLSRLGTESVREEGTAIGMAISVGVNRLKKSDAASKVMILVTDGDNNAGTINPTTASELALESGIKIYTIGVGTDKTIIPYNHFGTTQYRQIDGGLNEILLKQIAEETGGKYYRARDVDALKSIFQNIDRLEETEFEDQSYIQYRELAFPIIKIALIILALGLILDKFYFIRIP